MEFKDYYKILGISKNASQEEIQRAYRKLARKFHPDINKEKGADDKFKEIGEAYKVLKDPEKRKRYDLYGKNWDQVGSQPPPGWETQDHSHGGGKQERPFHFRSGGGFGHTGDFSDFFNSLFGDQSFSDMNFKQEYSTQTPGRSHEAEITVSLEDVFHGTSKMITFQVFEDDGRGNVQPATKTLDVKIPKGLTDGSVIRLAGQGEKGRGGGESGNLLLKINIAPDPRFRIEEHDLHTVVSLSPWEAALGAKIPVETVDGSVTLTIPRGSQNGKRMRLRGKGLPKRDGKRGDLIVEFNIRIPDPLNEHEERLFKELSQISNYNPRKKNKQRKG